MKTAAKRSPRSNSVLCLDPLPKGEPRRAKGRMAMPGPGREADRAARKLFGPWRQSPDRGWAALEFAPQMRATGKLPPLPTSVVVYPDRPGLRR